MALDTLITTFDTNWAGVIKQKTPQFVSGYQDETIRNHMLLAYLRKYGRITVNNSGPMCVWNAKYNQQSVESTGDVGELVFNRWDLQRQLATNWRGYVATDAMTEKEYLMVKGSTGQILNRYAEVIPSLMEALTDHFSGQLFIDGNASGNENAIHGLESFFAVTSSAAGNIVSAPSDSYAGHSTVLGNESGSSWSTDLASGDRPNATLANDWPHGSGTVSYNWHSPIPINYTSSGWGTGATTWEANCERAIRQGVIWLTNLGGPKGRPKMCLLDSFLYTGYANHQAAKQRIMIPHKESQDLGFGDALNQEGVAIAYDYDVPAGSGYLVNVENVELASLNSQLFGYRGPEFDMATRSFLFYVGFWGNCRWRVRHFAKLAAYA